MSCTIDVLPYRIDGVRGTIVVSPEKVVISDTTAHHGKATFAVSGVGTLGDRSVWDLNISGKNLPVDDELRQALPATLLTTIDSVKFNGNIDFNFPKFVYHGDKIVTDATQPTMMATSPTRPATPVDIEMKGGVTFNNCSLDAGVPMKGVFGNVQMTSTVRAGKLATLDSQLNILKASVAERDLTDISMNVFKPADHQELYLQKIHGTLAGGPVAGEIRLSYPDDGPSRYLLSLAVRNADVATLVKESDKEIKGELTASLSLEGNWDGIAQRRGRGDVVVTGKELYHLPLMMGLFQVTNLALPIATPFKSGTASYSIEGPRVTFENVELRSDNMLMSGTGHLDFKTKQVLMTFTTDNPNGFKVPFVNDLIKNARGELLKITVKGTIQEPKVQANSFGTVTTTIDQVLKNDAGK
jgi:hypothetical protein